MDRTTARPIAGAGGFGYAAVGRMDWALHPAAGLMSKMAARGESVTLPKSIVVEH